MLRIALVLALLVATATTALADPEAQVSSATTPAAPTGSLAVQLGILPGFTMVGLEYTHAITPHFELAADAAAGSFFSSTLSASVIPRLHAAAGGWRFAVGAGAGIMRITDDVDGEGGLTSGTLVADALVGYETRSHLMVQLRAGVFGYLDRDDMNTQPSLGPIASLGAGFTF